MIIKAPIIERVNKDNPPLNIKLKVGSIITLERGSKISYPTHFEGDKRAIILSGEAFLKLLKIQPSRFMCIPMR